MIYHSEIACFSHNDNNLSPNDLEMYLQTLNPIAIDQSFWN